MNLIQETLFPPQGFPDQLYLGIRNPDVPRKAMMTHDIALQRDVINLIEDDTLTTDTYFGGFYCLYW